MFNPFANLTWRIGAIVAAGAAGLFFLGLVTQTIRIEGFKFWPIHIVGFKEEVFTLRLDLDKIKGAQELAAKMAREKREELEREYREKAERTDYEYQAKLAHARARSDAYARRMRIAAAGRASSGAGAASEGNATEGFDGPSETSFMVAVSRDDFDILTENTVRLVCAREWALALNEHGEDQTGSFEDCK